jgi:PKD repeat protein
VTFDGSGTTLDGTSCGDTCTYAWDFGDGGSAAGRIATHRFSAAGSYLVTLTVTSASGISATSTRTVVVGQTTSITASFTFSPTNPTTGQTIFLDASASTTPDGVAIVSWQWDFGNGESANSKQTTTTYSAARTWVVRLTVTDALGRTGTTTQNITVS